MQTHKHFPTTPAPLSLPPNIQLDHDIKYTIPSAGGLDLSILTSSLVPPEMVQEADSTWEFDTLLQEVGFVNCNQDHEPALCDVPN